MNYLLDLFTYGDTYAEMVVYILLQMWGVGGWLGRWLYMVVPDVSIVCPIQIPWWWIKSLHCGAAIDHNSDLYMWGVIKTEMPYRLFCNPFYFYSFSSSSSKK